MTDYYKENKYLRKRCRSKTKRASLLDGLRSLEVQSGGEGSKSWNLFFSGSILEEEKRWQEALEVYDELVRQFGSSKNAEKLTAVGESLRRKGIILSKLKKPDEAIAVYDEVVKRFGDAEEAELKEKVARAMVNKGGALGDQKKPDEEIAVYDEVVKRFGDAEEAEIKENVARAMVNKGFSLGEQKKTDEKIAVYDEVVKRFGDEEEIEIKDQVARAMVGKGITFAMQGKYNEAIAVSDEIVKRFGNAEEVGLKNKVALAMISKGLILEDQNKLDEAISVYDEVIKQFGDTEEARLKETVARAMINKGITLRDQKKHDEAISVYDEVVKRFEDAEEAEIKEKVAMAMVNKGDTFRDQKKHDEAISVYDEVIKQFGDTEEAELKETIARAMVNKGFALGQQKKPNEAITVFGEVVKRFGAAEEARVKKWVAWALGYKGIFYGDLGKLLECRKAFNSANKILPNDEFVQQLAASSILNIKETEGEKEKKVETINVYIEALLDQFSKEDQEKFFKEMGDREQRTEKFLAEQSNFSTDENSRAILLDLREWNSYTPAVPDQHEICRGGGYFIRYKGQGIVIDPGYDFIKNFGGADGRVCDINHIIITHAHNDHTQDFEPILSLIHQYNHKHRSKPKRIHLYLSHGVGRKFSGYLPLRNTNYIGRIEILNQGRKVNPQVIHLHGLKGARLTVLRAFHDDTITMDYSVGLGFEFNFGKIKRRVVFTGDTGLFPAKKDKNEKVIQTEEGESMLDIDMEGSKALCNEYPKQFYNPDLLVPHIGSIKKYEFTKLGNVSFKGPEDKVPLLFYPNHLGVRGLVMLLDKLRPNAAIISEFGEELKDVRFNLVRGIAELLEKRRSKSENKVFVVPGDFSVVYDIKEASFFCHDTKDFRKPEEIHFLEVLEPKESRFYCEGVKRTYLFSKAESKEDANCIVEQYHIEVKHHGQLYCRE